VKDVHPLGAPDTLGAPGNPLDILAGLDTLEGCLQAAQARNRGLDAARREWQAALERVSQERSLPDPVLSYGIFVQEVETRVGPQKQRLGLRQSIPWFGTLGVKGEMALAGAEAARQRYLNAAQNLARQVTGAYAEYYHLGAALRITRGDRELLAGWERLLRSRYATGRASYSDLIKAQVELGRLEDRVTALEERRRPLMARLNALLDLDPDVQLPWPEGLPPVSSLESFAVLTALLARRSPVLGALAAAGTREALSVDLARKSAYPDVTLGADWIQTDRREAAGIDDNGKDPLLVTIAVRIPLWGGRSTAAHREAVARRRVAAEREADGRRMLESELADRVFAFEDAQRRIALYRDSLIPKGNQSLEATFAAFEAGRSDFLEVLDAERTLLQFRLSLERARADLTRARAGIDALIGRAAKIGEEE
jgi:outer membrane protein TolC